MTPRFAFGFQTDYCVTKQLPPAAFSDSQTPIASSRDRPRADPDAEVDALLAEIGLLDLR